MRRRRVTARDAYAYAWRRVARGAWRGAWVMGHGMHLWTFSEVGEHAAATWAAVPDHEREREAVRRGVRAHVVAMCRAVDVGV